MKGARMWLLLSLLTLAALPPAGAPARQDSTPDAVDDYMRERMADLDIPGAAVAVVRDGAIVQLAGYGMANRQPGTIGNI